MQVSEKHNIPLEHSQTKLKRMSKKDLAKLLAELIEKMMKKEMARQVGVEGTTDERVIAMGALRMVHDICAKGAEEGLNRLLPKYGTRSTGLPTKCGTPRFHSRLTSVWRKSRTKTTCCSTFRVLTRDWASRGLEPSR